MMILYSLLNGQVYNLAELTPFEMDIFRKMQEYYEVETEWTQFTRLWTDEVNALFAGISRAEMTDRLLYRVCQDMASRLGIRQGATRR